jgi:tol-pal system protein YbgF
MRRLFTFRRTALRLAALSGLALLPFSSPAPAQDNTQLRPLTDRLDRLERDMNLLQRQVYRGSGANGAPSAVSPADSQTALNDQMRMDQLEDELRQLTGRVEEVTYGVDQLKQRLDKLSSDVDLRLTALEHGGTAAPAAPPPPGPPGLGGAPQLHPPGAGANPGEPPSRSGTLGTLSSGDTGTAAPQQTAAAGPGVLPSGTAQEQYNYAFGLLRQAKYPEAEQALRGFVQHFPNDPLSGNAQYWLGETYYVRKDYQNAATAFAQGYEKYPKGAKAADDLLKLGMSLAALGQKDNACRAYARLDKDFPTAPPNLKERSVSEKQRLGC